MRHKHRILIAIVVACHTALSQSQDESISVPRKAAFVTGKTGVATHNTISFEATTVRLANLSMDNWTLPPATDLTCTDHCFGSVCAEMCEKMRLLLYINALHSRFTASLKFARQITDNVLSLGAVSSGNIVAPAVFLSSSMKSYTASLTNKPTKQRQNEHFADVLSEHRIMYDKSYNLALQLLQTLNSSNEEMFINQYSLAIMVTGQAIDTLTSGLDQYSTLLQSCYRSIVETKTVSACTGLDADFAGRFEGITYDGDTHSVTIMNAADSEYVAVTDWDDVYVPFWMNNSLCWLNLDLVTIEGTTYYAPECDGTWCAVPTSIDTGSCFSNRTIACPYQCSPCNGPVCHTASDSFTVSVVSGRYLTTARPRTILKVHVNDTYVQDIAREIKHLYEQTHQVVSTCGQINKTAWLVTEHTDSTVQAVEDIAIKIGQIWVAVTEGLSYYSTNYTLRWNTFVYFGLGLGSVALVFTMILVIMEISRLYG